MTKVQEPYKYFCKPEPRENLGPIKVEYDSIFGKKVRVRQARIGMVRNAKAENRREVKVYLEPYPHVRIDKAKDLQGWYKGKHEKASARPRPCFTEALLTEPYGGYCPLGCMACYINSGIRGYRGTGLITVPNEYGVQVQRQLYQMRRGAAGYFTSFHEPFNPLETIYHNTEEAAKAFVEVGLPIFFLSRLRYPQWAIELLMKNRYSYAQKSINTIDPEDWKKLSPGALPLEDHFKDIARLKRYGVYVSVQVNPVIPGVTRLQQILALFRKLGEVNADHVIVKFIEAGYSWAPAIVEKMIKKFGDRGRKFAKLFNQNIGGERTIQESYRMKAHKLFQKEAERCGLTYSVCYEYRYERDAAGNPLSKTGISVGREFTTSDQCHGHRVPIFIRDSSDELFRPVKECPRTGCLYCTDDNEGVPRCGDNLMGQATALKLVDWRKPWKTT